MLTFLKKYGAILILLGVALIPFFSWTKANYLVASGDYFPPVFPFQLIENSRFTPFFIWTDKISAGMPAGLGVTKAFPYLSFWAVLEQFHFDIATIQKLWFVFLFFLSGFSMFYLYSVLFKKKASSLGGLVAALFYMFNPYVGLWRTYLSDAAILSYIFMPILLAVFIKGIRHRRLINRYLFFFVLLTTLLVTSASNPQIYLVTFLPILAYTVFGLITGKPANRKKFILFFLFCLFLSFLINIWWITSFVSSLFRVSLHEGISDQWVQETSGNASLVNLFRFLGKWSFDEGFWLGGKFHFYYPQRDWYYLPHFLIAGFSMSILAFAALLLKPRRRLVLFLSIMALGGLFLARGIRPPFIILSELFYLDLRGFILFREPFAKFVPLVALAYAPLIGLVAGEIGSVFSKLVPQVKKEKITPFLISVIVAVIILNGFSLISGDIFPEKNGLAPGYHIKVPSYWYSASEQIAKIRDDVRILLTPPNPGYSASYNWGYMGVDRTPMFIRKPVLSTYAGSGAAGYFSLPNTTTLIELVHEEMSKGRIDTALNLLRFLNTGYILHRNDLVWDALITAGEETDLPQRLKSLLDSQTEINLEERFGELSFYKIADQLFLPHFYIPQKMVYLDGKIEILSDVVSFKDYPTRLGTYVTEKEDLKANKESLLERASEIFITGDLTGEIYKRKLEEIVPDAESVFFAYVRWKPGGLAYPLVLKKEQLDEWRVKDDPEELLDKKLFYASKRISELEKWRTTNLNTFLEAYGNKMQAAIALLEKEGWQDERVLKQNILKIQVYLEVHNKRMFSMKFNEKEQREIEDIFMKLNDKLREIKIKHDFSTLGYTFAIPTEGSYQLIIKNEDFGPYLKDSQLKIEFLGREIITSPLAEAEQWISGGIYQLKKGEQELRFTKPQTINLLGDDDWQNSFSESLFVGKELITQADLEGAFPQEAAIYFKPIQNYQGDTYYKITFDYFAYEGEVGIAFIEDVGIAKRTLLIWEALPETESDSPRHRERVFISTSGAKAGEFYFWGKPKSQNSIIEFFDVKVEKIIEPTIILHASQIQKPLPMPKISFVKINPTKYKVRVEGAREPYTLVFSESFHKGWKAYVDKAENDYGETASYFNGEVKEGIHQNIFLDKNTFETWRKESIPEERHLLVNGYANSWYITPEDVEGQENYEIIIEFWHQRLFYLGIGVSLLTLLSCFGYLGFSLVAERFRR